MSRKVLYLVWIKDRQLDTQKTLEIRTNRDGSLPSRMRVRDTVCKSGLFSWSDYARLRIKILKR